MSVSIVIINGEYLSPLRVRRSSSTSCFSFSSVVDNSIVSSSSSLKHQLITYSSFINLWNKYFSHVKIPAHKSFAKCSVCTVFDSSLLKCSILDNPIQIRQKYNKHLEEIRSEKQEYYNRREMARNNNKIVSIIVDGMDQAKTAVPRLGREMKGTRGKAMGLRVMGVISHNHPNIPYMLLVPESFPGGGNLTCQIISEVLFHILQQREKQNLPSIDILYIQLDNCGADNKNSIVFTFFALLIASGLILQEIIINFLPVGHTHEDVDGMFGNPASLLRRSDVLSVQEMIGNYSSLS